MPKSPLVIRGVTVYVMLMILFAAAVCRLLSLTLDTDDRLRVHAGQSAAAVEIGISRGPILDRLGRPFTGTESERLALCRPTPEAVAALSRIPDYAAAAETLKSGKPAVVRVTVPVEARGITFVNLPRRYARNPLAVHLIGYLDHDGFEGLTGIEKSYDEVLRGGKIYARFPVDGRGEVLAGTAPTVDDTGAGKYGSVTLTLDRDIQAIAERAAAEKLDAGAVVILDVKTGKILADVSVPTFSPIAPGKSLNDPASPLINRSLYSYNVGSVFKLVVAAAALERGFNPKSTFRCTGKMKVGDLVFNCHAVHETVNLEESLRDSCNLYFIDLAAKIGAEPIHTMAAALGFGQSREIAKGILPDPGVLTSLTFLKSQPASLANFAFGQGDLMLTPLQVSVLTAAVANGGKALPPTAVEKVTAADGSAVYRAPDPVYTKIMSPETAALLRRCMEQVVESGTGKAGKPAVGTAGAKTGTAETGWVKEGRRVVQAWFSGYWPAENPRYVVTVISEDAVSGGRSSGPVFKQIVEGIAALEAGELNRSATPESPSSGR